MLDYYMELITKPKYMLSESEQLFIDVFPLIGICVVGLVCLLFAVLVKCAIALYKKVRKRK